ncbi:MAG: hypothetical protein VX733_02610 [Candidatus Latescibacterota bacterium]|nr:hypothetical protein [Candidatus Latescibacterota bacterium]
MWLNYSTATSSRNPGTFIRVFDSSTVDYLLAIAIAAAATGLCAALAAIVMRQRRLNRLRLRVLAGRRRILGEEIAQNLENLDVPDEEALSTARVTATAAVDQIHIGLLDRQSQLQTYEDLASLQDHKIAILGRQRQDLRNEIAGGGKIDPEQSEEPLPIPEEHRERLEDELLEQIESLQPPPRKRLRRR